MKHVYIVIANEDEKVKECVVVEDQDVASATYMALTEIWGNANVAFISRKVNAVPVVVSEHWARSNTACSRPPIMRRFASWLKTNINLGRGG